jgi:hypothetical protein
LAPVLAAGSRGFRETFGRVDQAFEATNNPVTVDSLEAATDIAFRPNMSSIRNDPRFIGLA